ncbi:ABC transporter substrate-binding protein [Herbiconiux sp. KACC 21604]|uniref:heme/hemin ABC transporter substrate-binding protein n=1 Tax=unclassified Herbiconiux TaxID=2618217 RepID=UPI0014918875|nr:ABC transporter substrate-binding protein [Herbiconiux sp. SALV-R1]QJU55613.1 ABC transporter substrate-binding protein [Herbiconiux sp. SALV-R1]WPO86808.1 ABC transporter substrate-binding protein [Herbiconiux sp. KACC 21604]
MMRARHFVAAVTVLAVTFGLTACGAGAPSGTSGAPATPPLSEVTPLSDPLAWEGPSTAVAATAAIDPVVDGAQVLPVTVTDAQGTSVTVTDASRILTLDIYGSLSRIVFELGLGASVVARDTSSGFPEAADLPVVTENGHDLNAEAILEAAPTVILTDTSLGPWDTILQLRDAGIPVVVVDSHRSLESVGSLIDQVGTALGVPERADALAARSDAAVAEKIAQIAAVAPADPVQRLRMMFLYVRGQSGVYYLFGEESGADSLIRALGGIDVAGEIGWKGMRPVTDEALVDANPDLLIMMTKGLESVGGVDGLVEHLPAIAQTDAGRNHRIVDMSDTTVLSFGPASADVLDALAVAIYAPEAAG